MSRGTWSRRAVLRGIGAGLALPLLDAMLDTRGALGRAHAQDPVRPTPFFVFGFGNGTRMRLWTPGRDGPLTRDGLSPALQPLGGGDGELDVTPWVTVVTGLDNTVAHRGSHSIYCMAVGARIDDPARYDPLTTPSIDQIAAAALGGETRLRSIVVVNERIIDGRASYISHRESGGRIVHVEPYTRHDRLFADLFGVEVESDAVRAARARRASLLDFVREDATRACRTLGAADRMRCEEHLSAVRDLEREIEASAAACAAPSPEAPGPTLRDSSRLYLRLLARAVQCDVTRYVAFTHSNSFSGAHYTWIPEIRDLNDHDHISHSGEDPTALRWVTLSTQAKVADFAYLLRLLAAVEDPAGGTLLDQCLLYLSSELSEGNQHRVDNMPILVAGGASGRVRRGVHLRYAEGTTRNRLFVSLLRIAAVPTDRFGDANGPLDRLAID